MITMTPTTMAVIKEEYAAGKNTAVSVAGNQSQVYKSIYQTSSRSCLVNNQATTPSSKPIISELKKTYGPYCPHNDKFNNNYNF